MKFKVLDRLKVSTPDGERELEAGQVITLSSEKAVKLMNEGRITPTGRYAIKIYSSILEEYLWIVQDSNDWPGLKEKEDPIYDAEEIWELEDMGLASKELRTVHELKKIFKGSRINNEQKN